ncbi:PREDICTED: ABC transporter G family member 25-like [Populus euphratica]|uniref:ABC transporter G family member 25-like n=1 Tax=Populus euphratica TaxID=75702 RepID=A0AAJ6X1D8_POPEU|nr:PREDICTED: ABC transporter G family member 25-like [Populus euphratica]
MPVFSTGVETPRRHSPDGPDQSKVCPPPPPRDSCDLPSLLLSSCYPITLKFMDVGYRVKFQNKNKGSNIKRIFGHGPTISDQFQDRTILNGITGMASPGEILAILGPSGSGKSTLLNALSGRIQANGFTGTVLTNNRKPVRQIMKRIGFVTQDDILYPHLTVRETLVFCSLLRLPKSLSKQDKTLVAESVISELGLAKCGNTIIGNGFIRGISGGERKRVSIAHEMLINPSLLILDEPTSGLDATAAYRLLLTLGTLAQKGKTIVTSMHQPSSRVYQMFDSVLVLSEGRCLYFGKGSEAMAYFQSVGYSPSFPMNPADFLLDLANGVCQLDGASELRDQPNVKQSLIASYNTLLAPKVKAACMESGSVSTKENGFIGSHSSKEHRSSDRISISSWFNQFSILLQRSLKERKHESFNTLRISQVIMAAVLAGLMWWHSDFRDIQDRLGLLFFMSIFWGVFPSSNSVFVFPQERAIFVKERASGMYTLSSYFMSRIVGDLPMELILPTIFLSVTYWMAGLKPELGAFLLTLLLLLGYVLVSQGLGLALGAAIMDAKQASTIVTITMLAFVLTGGFYVHKLPPCMAWIKYISTTFYVYKLLINAQYGGGKNLSSSLGCSLPHGSDRASCKFVEQDVAGQISPAISVGALIFMFVGYRLLAYLALRRIKA